MSQALIIVDVQNDFMPQGALAVPQALEIIEPIQQEMKSDYTLVVATKDWHPHAHMSFASQHTGKQPFDSILWRGEIQVLWPDHCVENTWGAEFSPLLDTSKIDCIIYKGTDRNIDSYSVFFDNHRQKSTELHRILSQKHITELTFCGLAGDFCVAYSVNDALDLGYKVRILNNGIRSINPENFSRYLEQWRKQGVKIV